LKINNGSIPFLAITLFLGKLKGAVKNEVLTLSFHSSFLCVGLLFLELEGFVKKSVQVIFLTYTLYFTSSSYFKNFY